MTQRTDGARSEHETFRAAGEEGRKRIGERSEGPVFALRSDLTKGGGAGEGRPRVRSEVRPD